MDQDIKRKMKEVKRKIGLIKKWNQSNKQIVDFKIKENQKNTNEIEVKIKSLQIKLEQRIEKIGE